VSEAKEALARATKDGDFVRAVAMRYEVMPLLQDILDGRRKDAVDVFDEADGYVGESDKESDGDGDDSDAMKESGRYSFLLR
jgi:hypothetical protein